MRRAVGLAVAALRRRAPSSLGVVIFVPTDSPQMLVLRPPAAFPLTLPGPAAPRTHQDLTRPQSPCHASAHGCPRGPPPLVPAAGVSTSWGGQRKVSLALPPLGVNPQDEDPSFTAH